jgi:phosphoinositide-3-kinase regulatory subunit 4
LQLLPAPTRPLPAPPSCPLPCVPPPEADFSFFFDTGGRRRCYLAPERFYEGPAGAIDAAAPLTPEMVRRCLRRCLRRSLQSAAAVGACGAAAARPSPADPQPLSLPPPPPTILYPPQDVFAAGCAIGELLLDGRALFDLGQLLAYRRGDAGPVTAALQGSADPLLAQLAAHMIQLRPGARGGLGAGGEQAVHSSGGRDRAAACPVEQPS